MLLSRCGNLTHSRRTQRAKIAGLNFETREARTKTLRADSMRVSNPSKIAISPLPPAVVIPEECDTKALRRIIVGHGDRCPEDLWLRRFVVSPANDCACLRSAHLSDSEPLSRSGYRVFVSHFRAAFEPDPDGPPKVQTAQGNSGKSACIPSSVDGANG